tara:strand:+ start:2502 stop:3302 length:801 start_codon:yes stop_codon:yes gene_type:complete
MIEKYINEIKEKGIVRVDNFLNKDETIKISEIIKYYSSPKGDPKSYFPTNLMSLYSKLLSLNFPKFFHSFKILNLNKKKQLKKFANKFFGEESLLAFIDAYYSKASNQAILQWHTDQAYSGEKNIIKFNNPKNFYLKIFIYLTDVNHDNGCMSYIPGSHKIGFIIRKSIFEKKINYQPYWSIKDFKKIILDNKKYFINNFNINEEIEKFLEKVKDLEFINSSDIYSYEAKAGTAVIFDEGGIHRGSKPKFNDRMVLRYMYSRKKQD